MRPGTLAQRARNHFLSLAPHFLKTEFADTGDVAHCPSGPPEEILFPEPAPEGLIQPIRGFGKVWVDNEWVRQALGWATAAEQAYSMEAQETQVGYSHYMRLFSLPDGRIVRASVSLGFSVSWQFTTRR